MDFDPATGGLHCPYCDHMEEIPPSENVPQKAEELDFASAELTGNCDWGVAQKTVTCKSCGATSVYDALEVASECPYCGSNQVMEMDKNRIDKVKMTLPDPPVEEGADEADDKEEEEKKE